MTSSQNCTGHGLDFITTLSKCEDAIVALGLEYCEFTRLASDDYAFGCVFCRTCHCDSANMLGQAIFNTGLDSVSNSVMPQYEYICIGESST